MKESTYLELEGSGPKEVSSVLDVPKLFASRWFGVMRGDMGARSRGWNRLVAEVCVLVAVIRRGRRGQRICPFPLEVESHVSNENAERRAGARTRRKLNERTRA